MIEMDGKRESGKSLQVALDDDDDVDNPNSTDQGGDILLTNNLWTIL